MIVLPWSTCLLMYWWVLLFLSSPFTCSCGRCLHGCNWWSNCTDSGHCDLLPSVDVVSMQQDYYCYWSSLTWKALSWCFVCGHHACPNCIFEYTIRTGVVTTHKTSAQPIPWLLVSSGKLQHAFIQLDYTCLLKYQECKRDECAKEMSVQLHNHLCCIITQ